MKVWLKVPAELFPLRDEGLELFSTQSSALSPQHFRLAVSRRVRYVLRSYLDWGVLQETGTNGIYTAGTTIAVDDSRLIAWLAEAFLQSRANNSFPLKDLLESPSLFPFRLKPIHAESLVAASSRLDILRHGLDDDLIMLKERPAKGGAE